MTRLTNALWTRETTDSHRLQSQINQTEKVYKPILDRANQAYNEGREKTAFILYAYYIRYTKNFPSTNVSLNVALSNLIVLSNRPYERMNDFEKRLDIALSIINEPYALA